MFSRELVGQGGKDSSAKTFALAPSFVAASQASSGITISVCKSKQAMLSIRIWAFALTIGLVNAFRDTSPFFLFSTSE